jgi:hypothetical protein
VFSIFLALFQKEKQRDRRIKEDFNCAQEETP